MSFDISRLTNAVNKYLNSISDVGAAASKASAEIADRTQFASDLGDAIKRNIASRTREMDSVPDVEAIVKGQVEQATSGINSTFEQVNGAFLEISGAGRSASAKDNSDNHDAYAGTLSADALKELSNSQYFSANLIQSSLFQESDEEDSSSTTDSFNSKTLDQLNTDSLTANALGKSADAGSSSSSSLSSVLNNSLNSTSGSSEVSGNDLAKALIKAYTSSGKTSDITSVFGDFSL